MSDRLAASSAADRILTLSPEPARPILIAMQTPATVTLNGESRALDTPISVAQLIDLLGLDTRKVAVERNMEIVPRSTYAETWLADGDELEIVHFIGGG